MPARTLRIFRRPLAGVVLALLAAAPAGALTLAGLLSQEDLTPKRLLAAFAGFEYEYGEEVQDPDAFLSSQRGDCDDFAVLADLVLHHHGYATRLIHVRLVGRVAHAVCYVTGDEVYLDYNNRKYFFNLEHSGPRIRDIANRVAKSLEGNWTSASEFTYDYSTHAKTIGRTVVKTEPPDRDPDANATGEGVSR